jgi:hypothetical protein
VGFNEKVHAYLVAKFYTHLVETFGDRGKSAFIHAIQYYAGQRGRRMAQRAIGHGEDLTHATFMKYNELAFTSDVKPTSGDLVSLSPHYEIRITYCPWHEQFKEMGCLQAGDLYCTHIDESLCRGFNPAIVFEAPQNLNSSTFCVHRVLNTYYREFPDTRGAEHYRRDFSYHCGHLYWSFGEAIAAIFGAEGEAVSAKVLDDFMRDYGRDMANELASCRCTNFNIC